MLNLLKNICKLHWWIILPSIIWFVDFLMTTYYCSWWNELFQMSMDIVDHMCPIIGCRDTNYREAIVVEAQVACAIYKLVHGWKYVLCFAFFAIGKSIVELVFWEGVCVCWTLYTWTWSHGMLVRSCGQTC